MGAYTTCHEPTGITEATFLTVSNAFTATEIELATQYASTLTPTWPEMTKNWFENAGDPFEGPDGRPKYSSEVEGVLFAAMDRQEAFNDSIAKEDQQTNFDQLYIALQTLKSALPTATLSAERVIEFCRIHQAYVEELIKECWLHNKHFEPVGVVNRLLCEIESVWDFEKHRAALRSEQNSGHSQFSGFSRPS